MPRWKSTLLLLYYHASIPYRWGVLRSMARKGRVPVVVLFYHRIAEDRANPWTTSYRSFQRQIRWLQDRFDLISLEEAQRRIHSGENRRPSASITFDDGYAENLQRAIPLLLRRRIPCTYFVTLQNVLEGSPFAHDVALGHRFPPHTVAELRMMADAGIEIGAHTYSHPDLAQLEGDQLRWEIVGAGEKLQRLLRTEVRYFAFPFGQHAHLTAQAFDLACQAGYEAVCSAYGGYNFPGQDAYHLQRIHGDEGMLRFKNWLTLDPRMARTRRFVYQPTGPAEPLVPAS